MRRLLVILLIPALLIGGLAAGSRYLSRALNIPPSVEWWLWPCVLAALLLACVGLATFFRAWKWVVAPLVGALVQIAGLASIAMRGTAEAHEDYPTTVLYALLAVVFVLFITFLFWLHATLRAGNLEKYLARAPEDDVGGDPREMARIRQNMLDALATLRKAGRGRNAIYELPWFLVFGRPAAGKTVAIKNSGLGLPVRKDWVKGTGGTYTADWFFTNEMIFVDTPGRWVVEGADEKGRKFWRQLLKLLQRHRGRRPLDGLCVVVPSEDLLTLSDQELEEQAARIRDVIDLIHEELRFQFPVYVLISKCDLVQGFVDFFHVLPPQRRHEMLGWSNEEPLSPDIGELVSSGFDRVRRRLEAYRLEMVARTASRQRVKRLFLFTEEFRFLEDPLRRFCETLFADDSYRATPIFRGFYFCSGTQGEGSPVARSVARLSEAMGVKPPAAVAGGDEQKKSYFLLDLFRELMIQDHGLVKRTAVHWLKQRRDTALGAFMPALFFGTALFFVGLAYLLNGARYDEAAKAVESSLQAIEASQQAALRALPDRASASQRATVYDLTYYSGVLERVADINEQERRRIPPGMNFLRWFGTDRHARVEAAAHEAWKAAMQDAVLSPMLATAGALFDDQSQAEGSCQQRFDLCRSLLSLRLLPGYLVDESRLTDQQKAEKADIEDSLRKLWRDASGERLDRMRKQFETQFSYVTGSRSGAKVTDLLTGYYDRLDGMAGDLERDCTDFSEGSRLQRYLDGFAADRRCAKIPAPDAGVVATDPQATCACYDMLRDVAEQPTWVDEKYLKAHREAAEKLRRKASDLSAALAQDRDGSAELEEFRRIESRLQAINPGDDAVIAFLVQFDDIATHDLKDFLAVEDAKKECAAQASPDICLLAKKEEVVRAFDKLDQKLALRPVDNVRTARSRKEEIDLVPGRVEATVVSWMGTSCAPGAAPRLTGTVELLAQSKWHLVPETHDHKHCNTLDWAHPVVYDHSHPHVHPHDHRHSHVVTDSQGRTYTFCHEHPFPGGEVPPHQHQNPAEWVPFEDAALSCADYNPCRGKAPPAAVKQAAVSGTHPSRSEPPPVTPSRPRPDAGASSGAPSAGHEWFEAPSAPGPRYTSAGWTEAIQGWDSEIAQLSAISTSEAKIAKADRVAKASDYIRDYTAQWNRYLVGIKLKPMGSDLPAWLARKGEVQGELRTLLAPVDDALRATSAPPRATELAFDVLQLQKLELQLQKLRDVASRWNTDLGALQRELQACASDPKKLADYRKALADGDTDKAVLAGPEHLDESASAAPAAFLASLRQPFDAAIPWLESQGASNAGERKEAVAREWKALRDSYIDSINGHFPFGDPTARAPLPKEDFVKFFGRKEGKLTQFLAHSQGCSPVPQPIVDWLQRANDVSKDFFKDGADDVKDAAVSLDVAETSIPDAEDLFLAGVHVNLAGQRYDWSKGQIGMQKLVLDLFDETTMRGATTISLTFDGPKDALKDFVGQKLPSVDLRTQEILRIEKPWSFLGYLDGKSLRSRDLKAVQDIREIGRITGEKQSANPRFTLRVDARPLLPYMRLRETPLDAPPLDADLDTGALTCAGP